MRRAVPYLLLSVIIAASALAHHDIAVCGTGHETAAETLFLHRQSALRHPGPRPRDASLAPDADMGNIAVIHDQNGIVERQNQFNLDGNSLLFQPGAGASYRYSVAAGGYDAAAAAQGAPLAALDDDDTRAVPLPFPFPFFGKTYVQVFVNSDGNLTFGAGDSASTPRSLSRMTAGPPRISPLFDDLDPSRTAGGVRVLSDASHVVVNWVKIPEYSATNAGAAQTFQASLFPDGRIEFAWSGAAPAAAVVGIAPGNLQGQTTILDFRTDPGSTYTAAVAEVFTNSLTIDPILVAQQFYQTHDDAFDYLVVYNNMDIPALGEGTVAYEQTARNLAGTGYGVPVQDSGYQFGSASRLQSLLNLGPLSQYPVDPKALVPARAPQGDTPITVLAHEAGHLFLAFASVRDPNNPGVFPMLGFQLAHWSFLFNSEASLLEGERILDKGAGASPRFLTTDTVQQYAPLDQYLMGLRAPADVPDTFYVSSPSPNYVPTLHPFSGIPFDGTRRNVTIADVIGAMGRRTPDSTLAQRHFRFAFVLVAAAGTQPSAAVLTQVDAYRQQFEMFFAHASSGNATADTTLQHSLKLSLFPWAGIAEGSSVRATLSLQTPAAAPLTIHFTAPNGYAGLPDSVVIPAAGSSASFTVNGLKAGVEDIQAIPDDPAYETAVARVQVAAATMLQLVQVPAATQGFEWFAAVPVPIAVRLTDANNLSYPQVRISAAPSVNGSVVPAEAVTDANGQATFQWNPGPAPTSQIRVAVTAMPSVNLTVKLGDGVPSIASVVNAASQQPGISPGALGAVLGANLAGAKVLLNNVTLSTSAATGAAVRFFVPLDFNTGPATLTVVSPTGAKASLPVTVDPLSPGLFPDGVLHNGVSAATTAVRANDALEIYCTGLGPVQAAGGLETTTLTPIVFVGAIPVTPFFSGLAPRLVGVYQVNIRVPAGLAPGPQQVLISVNLAHSNPASIIVQ